MKLKGFKVTLYRNIVDSGDVLTEDDVTCLVGKNESGKTALLQALYSLNPAYSHRYVNVTMDYPRWRKVHDEREKKLEETNPIQASFLLDDDDITSLDSLIPFEIPKTTHLNASRSYAGILKISLEIPEADLIASLLKSSLLGKELKASSSGIKKLDDLAEYVDEQLKTITKKTREGKNLSEFQNLISDAIALKDGEISSELHKALEELLPTFFYFSEYSSLRGRIDLTNILGKPPTDLEESEQTAISLLRLVGVQGKEFMDKDFEIRIAQLEAAANEVTRQVFDYWTQNKDIIVNFQSDSQDVMGPQGQTVIHRYLDIRLNDQRHQMTTNFESRSSGFQWFFSFIVAFSEFERKKNVIVLLDEPALNLHARAQADLLNFINKRLGPKSQVIYTTHSPFLVDPHSLNICRLVEDLTSRENPDIGSKVTTDVLAVQGDTLFPLQAALGYDLAQNLFVGPDNLVVEGTSDLVYLQFFSELLGKSGGMRLDPRFTITPVGGADKIPTFIALLGTHLDLTVLVDAKASKSQKIADMIKMGLLKAERLASIGQVSSIPAANIEDLFEPDEYINLYNQTFSKTIKITNLQGEDSIVNRIERQNSYYDHLAPAIVLLRSSPEEHIPISKETLSRFEKLFKILNATLPPKPGRK